jgi:flavocytochrome c
MVNRSWDIVIVGSGLAGLSAAVEAVKNKSSVLILEKESIAGGNSRISGGSIAVTSSSLQQRHNIQDSQKNFYKDVVNAGQVNDPELVEILTKNSTDAFNWLKTEIGVAFKDKLEQVEGHSSARIHTALVPKGSSIIEPLLTYALKLGVEIFTDCKALKINTDEKGEAIGVNIERNSKTYDLIVNKAIVIASGGHAGGGEIEVNDRSLKLKTSCLPSTSGEMINRTNAVGAETRDMLSYGFLPSTSPYASTYEEDNVVSSFNSFLAFPRGFLVDPQTGKRFINESSLRETLADVLIASLNTLKYADSDLKDKYLKAPARLIRRFDDLSSLASYYNIPQNQLLSTLDSYNQMLHHGQDSEFNKELPEPREIVEAPFLSSWVFPKVHYTPGGLCINANAQITSSKGKKIDRLYAAGEATGGVHGKFRLGGCALTDCIVFGRIAGKEASSLKSR